MIAVTQARGVGPGRDYLDKLLVRGKTRTEALRLLRRRLSDAVFAALCADEHTSTYASRKPCHHSNTLRRVDIGASPNSIGARHARDVHRQPC